MAGAIPNKRSASGRKQWPSHDGPNSSLKQLRSQFASEGCPESQVVLAKQLLNENCQHEIDKAENAKSGVYWLIKASEQGNEEATALLKTCFKTGKGITEQNYLDVQQCITMTQDEKLARKAAKEMFASLSNGGEYVTSYQLQRKILELDKEGEGEDKVGGGNELNAAGEPSTSTSNGELMNNYDELTSDSEDEIDWSQRSEAPNEKLTEDHLVSAAINFSHGHLPLVNRILCLQEPNLNALDNIPFIQRPILHPFLLLKILYYKLLKVLSKPFSGYAHILKRDIQWLTLLFLYTFVSSENTLYFLPLAVYYASFFIMIVTTFQTLQHKRDFFDFRLWSGLFICYSGGSLNAEQAEYQYIKNNLKPYGHFFLALLCNLMIYPIIMEQNLPQSELTIVSFLLTFMTLLGYMPKRRTKIVPDLFVLLSFAINVLAKYPYETDPVVTQGWRFLDLKIPTFASYIIGNGIEFCINFRILLYTFIPILFLRIAKREKWRGTYKFLIPHCVTLSWLQIVIINSQGATMFGLIRGTLGLVGFVLFLPLVGLTTIIIPAIALTKWLITPSIMYNIFLFAAFTGVGFCLCYFLAKTRYAKYSAIMQACTGIVALYFFITLILKDQTYYREKPAQNYVSWSQYQKLCYEPTWQKNELLIQTQIRCTNFKDVPVHWDGYIKDISIASTKNIKKDIIDKFPNAIRDYLYCYYGDKINPLCDHSENISYEDCIALHEIIKAKQRCSLDKYDEHELNIHLRMHNSIWDKGAEIILQASHAFTNFTLKLRKEDNIWFKGVLSHKVEFINETPKLIAKVLINELGCVHCTNAKLTKQKISLPIITYKKLLNDLYLGIKCVLNFIFNPIVVFK